MDEWRFDSGRRCLDLMAEPPTSPERLARWLAAAGLVPPGTPLPGVDRHWVERFGELRGHIETLVRAELAPQAAQDGAPDRVPKAAPDHKPGRVPEAAPDPRRAPTAAALARLNSLAAAAAPPAPRAVRAEDGRLVRVLDTPPDCGALLALLARDAVELLTDPAARARLRQCDGDHCARVYLDTSRGRRRRWCSSEVCGNRERVARHRARAGRTREKSPRR
ncbi:CGNR zinc finger domain-containing protein [Streptomyces sp. NPDC047928]|uniref:CGNR zinc finger domain-containing protein n=1 Tax=unclassified Streptomyces TaxID=2593676 RepID=UPI003711E7DB